MISRAMLYYWVLSLVLMSVCAARRAGAADQKPFPTLQAKAIAEPIELDGSLSDPSWREVPAASGFVQREPAVGAAASEATEIPVAFTPARRPPSLSSATLPSSWG